jgi:hypothetical protein
MPWRILLGLLLSILAWLVIYLIWKSTRRKPGSISIEASVPNWAFLGPYLCATLAMIWFAVLSYGKIWPTR